MRLLILLSLIFIVNASFCINGVYNYGFIQMYQNCTSASNLTLMVESKVRTFSDEYSIKNVKDIRIGDMVESFGGYTKVTNIKNTNFKPRLFTDYLVSGYIPTVGYVVNLNDKYVNNVFTDNIPIIELYKRDYKIFDCRSTIIDQVNGYELIQIYNTQVNFTLIDYICNSGYLIPCNNSYCYDHNCDGINNTCSGYRTVNCQGYIFQIETINNYGWISDIVDYINDNNAYDLILDAANNGIPVNLYHINKLEIYDCDAVNIETENGYIVVNDILFKTAKCDKPNYHTVHYDIVDQFLVDAYDYILSAIKK